MYKDKIENQNVQNADEKSSNLTKNIKPLNNKRRQVDFNEFRWLLSSFGMIANFYCRLGMQK